MNARTHRIVFWSGVAALFGAHMWPRLMPDPGPAKLWFGLLCLFLWLLLFVMHRPEVDHVPEADD